MDYKRRKTREDSAKLVTEARQGEVLRYKMIENELLPIYENENKEQLVNARELHRILKNKRKFTDWIKQRIEQYEFIEDIDFTSFSQFCEKPIGGRPSIEYYITVDMAKQLSMVENNNVGKQIEEIQSKIDVTIKKDYCLASDIAEQLQLYSESGLPHSNLIGAIARQLGYKTSYKHYYEDDYIAIVSDISKGNDFWQVYYKTKAVEQIIDWFNKNKEEIEYKVIYQRNGKNGTKGEIKEKGYKIEDICYKINI